jgi:hypothetical protein
LENILVGDVEPSGGVAFDDEKPSYTKHVGNGYQNDARNAEECFFVDGVSCSCDDESSVEIDDCFTVAGMSDGYVGIASNQGYFIDDYVVVDELRFDNGRVALC